MTGKYPSKSFKDAVEAISSLPGVGSRGALRLVLHLLRQPSENVHHLAEAISGLADNVHYCKTCMMVSDGDSCSICSDPKRDHSTICVVENVRDVMRIEETGQYHGVYHVLGGIISPINGIGPSDITVRELIERLKQASGPVEVIFALSGSVEGETTAFYIYRQIEGLGVKVSTLARGLSFGADLEYADSLTLGRSIIDRQIFKP
ncbi:MAG: recombination protein RecR [Bacteroidetes bacterium]|uniref:Recombination protein RecR n=1 Tax=Candidatus Cryptobacteroides avistercoris TaxID=2840758 RepID=A0A9D9IXX3_9BACT|nr:recombination protein RecR [Candidatus Cryptobacteroides avistercoris]